MLYQKALWSLDMSYRQKYIYHTYILIPFICPPIHVQRHSPLFNYMISFRGKVNEIYFALHMEYLYVRGKDEVRINAQFIYPIYIL